MNEVDFLKDKNSVSILAIILSAPKNFIARNITRRHLQGVLHRKVKWAFVIGQTSVEIQVRK